MARSSQAGSAATATGIDDLIEPARCARVRTSLRVLHVVFAPENTGYQDSLVRPEHRAVGGSVDEVWTKLLRAPDRFRHVDPAMFLHSAATRDEYVNRYSPAVAIDA